MINHYFNGYSSNGIFTYAKIPIAKYCRISPLPDRATSVAFENNGTSLVHVAAALNGSIKKELCRFMDEIHGTSPVDLNLTDLMVNQFPMNQNTPHIHNS